MISNTGSVVQDEEKSDRIDESLEFCADIYRYYKRSDKGFDPESIVKDYTDTPPKKKKQEEELNKTQIIYIPDYEIERRKDIATFLKKALIIFLLIFTVTLVCRTFFIQETLVEGSSMMPTLSDDDRLMLIKPPVCGSFKRYDIVVFTKKDGELYVKRIIGLPGERLLIKEGHVYINGELLYDDPLFDDTMKYSGAAANEITLKDNEYFVLGDNRNNSYDSRFDDVGLVDITKIEGKVFLRIYPFKNLGTIE